eukprot:TRINITY_DN2177_c0_g1_i6.p1 TRINITY_DN2177_c0_g1~~TRINITY_DN2177_c0_g1_i6.p1  ORF type:complete len:322 (+),score=91.63 TRINITY_DN2177_c0_g1_i6:48-1013(+)
MFLQRVLAASTLRGGVQRYAFLNSRRNFSSNIRLSVDLSWEGNKKRFFINDKTTVADFQKLLKEEFPEEEVAFVVNDNVVNQEDPIIGQPFSHVLRENLVNLRLGDRIEASFEFDALGSIFYISGNPLDQSLANNQVPTPDSIWLRRFSTQLIERVTKNSKGTFSIKDLQTALNETFANFNKTPSSTKALEVAEKNLLTQQAKVDEAQKNFLGYLDKKAKLPIKLGIAAIAVQWAVLFYLTYGVYGWDVTEPIGYLIALSLETLGLFYFIRKGIQLSQTTIYDQKKKQLERSVSRSLRNREIDARTLRRQLTFLQYAKKLF